MSSIFSAVSDMGLSPDPSIDDFDEPQQNEENHAFVKGLNEFAFKLYKCEEKKTNRNVLISPINPAVCLVIAWVASEGETAKEFAEALQLQMDSQHAASGMCNVLATLQGSKSVTLWLMNKVYTNRGIQVKKSFKKFCWKKLKTDSEEVDFTVPDSTRRSINQWVDKKTKGICKEYLSPYNIREDTKLLFVSATYFRAGWFKSFNESATKKGEFKTVDGKTVEVAMLHGSFQLKYHIVELLDARGITLTFYDDSFQMILLLPNSPSGFSRMEEKLETLEFRDLSFTLRAVNVTVPKFRIERSHQMKDVLAKIGVKSIFEKKSKLTHMVSEPIHVDDIFNTMAFGITEHGTCEDARSGESQQKKMPSETVDFTADRPFLFIVKREADIIFLGRVMNPTVT